MAKIDLLQNLKFARAARDLGISHVCMLGHLEMFWLKAYQTKRYCFEEPEDIEFLAEWNGEPGAFVETLERRGFLDRLDGEQWQVHDFFEHCPRFVKKYFERNPEKQQTPQVRTESAQSPPTVRTQTPLEKNKNRIEKNENRKEYDSAELSAAPNDSTPESGDNPQVFLSVPCSGNPKSYGLPHSKVDEYQELYGEQIAVEQELRKAAQWLKDNPSKRKTARGMPRFFNAWLMRTVDSGRGKSESPPKIDLSMSGGNPFANGKGVVK